MWNCSVLFLICDNFDKTTIIISIYLVATSSLFDFWCRAVKNTIEKTEIN